MKNQILVTSVDEIVTFIKHNPHKTIAEISKVFKIKEDIVDKWVAVLEEYNVCKVEFHGLEGKVEFIEDTKTKKKVKVDQIKDLFIRACYAKKISTDKMKELWVLFFDEYEIEIKKEFEKECEEKKFDKKKIPLAWERFKQVNKTL
ncbi:MAG: hypothetical protein LAT82_01115 [Nanoarchaeota archaeon]|nr:hypothetical protein [Nanoarchaeota archaeon]